MEIKRLFDALEFQLNKFGNKADIFGAKVNGLWQTTSAEQTIRTVNNLSAGLLIIAILSAPSAV